jgi:lipoprotein-anchoring transpeptidase ErfK/SrfK
MKPRSFIGRIVLVLGATVMFVLSATLAWAVVSDHQVRGLVPKGVTVVGHDLSGMTESQARAELEDAISAPMFRPLTITGDKKTWIFASKSAVAVDVEAMLDDAYSTRRSATLVARLNSQLRGVPLPNVVEPVYSIDSTAIASWVDRAASHIDRPSKDAIRKVVKYAIKITPSVTGARVDRPLAVEQIASLLSVDVALSTPDRILALPVTFKKPKVLESSFKIAVVISISQRRIRLYNGTKLIRTYRCAPGQPAYPTPTGDFVVQTKQAYASWINPHDAWSASMPDVIGPGPGNPMGVRKIGIDYPGVYMHGIPPGEFGSIGTAASHGCIRMMPDDVLDLYGRVEIGSPVFIRD